MYGLDFYRYAEAQLDYFPMKGWAFFYPPIWILLLAFSLFLAPGSSNGRANGRFCLAGGREKPPSSPPTWLSAFYYLGVPGSNGKNYYSPASGCCILRPGLNPGFSVSSMPSRQFSWLASVIMLIKNKDMLAFFLAGLAFDDQNNIPSLPSR